MKRIFIAELLYGNNYSNLLNHSLICWSLLNHVENLLQRLMGFMTKPMSMWTVFQSDFH